MKQFARLRQLWVAGNRIEEVRGHLDGLLLLEDLNLSANKICHFRETLNLLRLPRMRILCFRDPQFGKAANSGANPICSLCNYETFVIFHFQQLEVFDSFVISEEIKQQVEVP